MIRLNRLPSVSTAMYKQVMVVTHPLGFAWSLCDKQQAQMPYSSIPILLTNFPYSHTLDKFKRIQLEGFNNWAEVQTRACRVFLDFEINLGST